VILSFFVGITPTNSKMMQETMIAKVLASPFKK
jgi:hypothetical protein